MGTRRWKSACCGAEVQRFGGRRRRCRSCGRTWRVRPRRRGRKPRRLALGLLGRTLLEGQSLVHQAAHTRCPVGTLRRRFRDAVRRFLANSAAAPAPAGDVILIIDGVWFRFATSRWTLYLLAAKPLRGAQATLRDPVLLPGKEALGGWLQAVATLRPELLARVRAVVSDGFPGAKILAQRYGWIQQRCHFHLIAQLQARRGRRKRLPGWEGREALYQAIREAIETRSVERLRWLRQRVRRLGRTPACPRRLRMVAADFLREIGAFRTFLDYPDLGLPTTTNTLEAMAKIIRARVRPLSTPASLQRWATALVRLRPLLTCNGRAPQPK